MIHSSSHYTIAGYILQVKTGKAQLLRRRPRDGGASGALAAGAPADNVSRRKETPAYPLQTSCPAQRNARLPPRPRSIRRNISPLASVRINLYKESACRIRRRHSRRFPCRSPAQAPTPVSRLAALDARVSGGKRAGRCGGFPPRRTARVKSNSCYCVSPGNA